MFKFLIFLIFNFIQKFFKIFNFLQNFFKIFNFVQKFFLSLKFFNFPLTVYSIYRELRYYRLNYRILQIYLFSKIIYLPFLKIKILIFADKVRFFFSVPIRLHVYRLKFKYHNDPDFRKKLIKIFYLLILVANYIQILIT